MDRKVLTADEGMILTDGNTYGRIIYLADGMSADDFRQITEAEYEALQAAASEISEVNDENYPV